MLSRLEPDFVPAGGGQGRPLADPFLSRTPIVLKNADGGVGISVPPGVQLEVDALPVSGGRYVDPEELERGTVLTVAERMVLFLHLVSWPRPEAAPKLGLVGESEAIEQLRADVLRVADLSVPVLIRGESGSGKELVARAIHQRSRRAAGPCICVSMAAIPPSTAASELFGHAAGAFTGAAREHSGHFARASGGTLFLDEIGEMPVDIQALLLRAVETGELQRLNSTRMEKVDVRLITATDANLEESIRAGRFREPLFHRLAGFQLRVPPLRKRREDIGRLLLHFLEHDLAGAGEAHKLERGPDAKRPFLHASDVARLLRCAWPGNVRQLRNVVSQIVISSRGSEIARIDETVEALLQASTEQAAAAAVEVHDAPERPWRRAAGEIPDEELMDALRRNEWKTSLTARALGISRTTLYGRMERSPVIRKAGDVPPDELTRVLSECGNDLDVAAARLEVSKRGLQLRLRHGTSS
ncbi:MAG: sigma 54-interacting transcriptional regulator [Myxococcales bacterium]